MFLLPLLALTLSSAPSPAACRGPLSRDAVVECATASSPRVRADREHLAASREDVGTARVLLPSNPTASVTVAHRTNAAGDSDINVTGSIAQAIEIGGQRRKRIAVAHARAEADAHTVTATERAVVAEALLAYYDVIAASEERVTLERAAATLDSLAAVARGRAAAGLAAELDAELVAAESTVLAEQVALARGRERVAKARLASALGLDPVGPLPRVVGSLDPLPVADGVRVAVRGAQTRPELDRVRADGRAERADIDRLERERIPNPSLSVFVQRDGFDERVIGGGLSMPIPLPAPLGRTHRAEIAAARARVRENDARLDATQRAVGLEVAVAYYEYEARAEASAVYSDATAADAERRLDELDEELERGRLPVSDALRTREALIDLLVRRHEAAHALCRTSVALALAAGSAWTGGDR